MKVRATSLSWIPSDSVFSLARQSFELGMTHWDRPPPDRLDDDGHAARLRDADKIRWANVLSVRVETSGGRITGAGYEPDSDLLMGSTTVRVAGIGATFRAVSLPTLQTPPAVSADGTSVRFVQTVGGRTGAPAPRKVARPPYVQWAAPTVWTTVALSVHADGSTQAGMPGASPFPRHWLYGPDGRLSHKSGVTEEKRWMSESFGDHTPWGDQDNAVLVVAVESALERQLSSQIMRPDRTPEIRRLPAGRVITEQGTPGTELYLLLDGVVRIDVDATARAEVGPGAVLGERALLEGGLRTGTLTAVTPVRLAVASAGDVDLDHLRALAATHRREDGAGPTG